MIKSAPVIGAGILDVTIFLLNVFGLNVNIPTWGYACLLGIGFLVESYRIYLELDHKHATGQALTEHTILLKQHRTKTSNAVLMQNIGEERADNLKIFLSYKDKQGQQKEIQVEQFFPPNDPQMLYHAGPIFFLEPNQEVYFYLLDEENNSEGKVTVNISFTGAKSHQDVHFSREFPLNDRYKWYTLE